jgi:DUF4097 and DUF4098 domain-containing protein YvlB
VIRTAESKENPMFHKRWPLAAALFVILLSCSPAFGAETRTFPAAAGGTLELDLEAGGDVTVRGGGGSTITVTFDRSGRDPEASTVEFEESSDGLKIVTRFVKHGRNQSSSIDIDVVVPSPFDVELDSMGGGLSIEGLDGTFRGKTMGGALRLRDVRGEAELKTMGGGIELTDSELDGSLETMGGPVLFENVVGDVRGSSMGGNVRFKNVVRRGGEVAVPPRLDSVDGTSETVQISTMGGTIEVEDAPEGANLHTMGGDIRVERAARFVAAKTMGGDIEIEEVDGWVRATTMGGDIEVTVVGSGGDVELTSMSGDVTLRVPSGFSMELDLEIAYTRGSSHDYRIVTDYDVKQLATREWDHDHGSPRKYLRGRATVGGGQHRVKIRTVNGSIRVE